MTIDRKQQRINDNIRVSPIRVVNAKGEQLGIITRDEALEHARTAGLDLVEVAPDEKPPVGRIMDFGKYKYAQKKRTHKTYVHQSKNKEIRLRPKIGKHDLDTKVSKARKFLSIKDKVIFSVIFRGRENAHVDEGFKIIEDVIAQLADVSKVEQPASMQGKRIVMILSPK